MRIASECSYSDERVTGLTTDEAGKVASKGVARYVILRSVLIPPIAISE